MIKKAKILLVEDNISDQVMVQRALEDCKISCDLLLANNGLEAVNMLYEWPSSEGLPDLILMDINMPVMDGMSAVKKIRENNGIKHIPIIMLSTSNAERDVVESYQIGVNAFLTKPISDQEFIKRIQEIENFWFQIVVLPNK